MQSITPVIQGIFIPFLGTVLGSALVFFVKSDLDPRVERVFNGFAAGVIVAVTVWSLLIPSMEQSAAMGQPIWIAPVVGFWIGILFLLLLDRIIPHIHVGTGTQEGPRTKLSKTIMLVLAVTLHNLPEGMAVGVVFAGYLAGTGDLTAASAMALALGIAIQNFPEGAIISLPLRAEGLSRTKSFAYGALSGVVEPIGAVLTILASSVILPVLPYTLSFAAGAMMYVVVEELIPETAGGPHSDLGIIAFAAGFTLMMVLDVVLG